MEPIPSESPAVDNNIEELKMEEQLDRTEIGDNMRSIEVNGSA